MSDIKDGGRAFPWCGDLNETPFISLGMTLRDYFAAKALQGLLACATADESGPEDLNWTRYLSELAYEYADAMLRARES